VETIGDAIYEALKENTIIESEPWALERVGNIMKRLAAAHPAAGEFKVVIPWMEKTFAFTAPGRYIFFCRGLFQLCSSEDMAAMVIAHEIAHHDLGHFHAIPDWLARMVGSAGVVALGVFMRAEHFLYGPERECDADRRALEMCIVARYDPLECIALMDKLEKIALDFHDLGAVYGLDGNDEDELSSDASFNTKFRIWLYQRRRGYLPIQDRRAVLLKHLHFLKTGDESAAPPDHLTTVPESS
jgi:predicted Zn-dependent protease